jgi:NADPH-dependent curcumin reductase CurA
MPASVNRQIVLRRRPVGMPTPGDFELVESPLPAPKDGEILSRTI